MENEIFELEIISPTSSQSQTVNWINVESPTGKFFVGHNHAPLISLIKKKSTLQYKKADEKAPTALVVHEGFLRVTETGKALLILLL